MRRRKRHILLFVEDPGAANYVQYLPTELAKKKVSCTLLADGSAQRFFEDRQRPYTPLDNTTATDRMLARWHPDIVIVGTSSNPDTSALRILTSARAMNIRTIGIVDNLSNAQFRFRGRSNKPLQYAPDWLVVPDHPTGLAFKSFGFPAGNIRVCGHPQYDHVVRCSENWNSDDRVLFRKNNFRGISNERQVFLFATVPFQSSKSPLVQKAADFTLKGRGGSRAEPAVVIEEFIDAVNILKPKPFLVLRIHPKQKPENFFPYLDEFDFVSSGGSPLELLYASDLIAGLPTMLLVEATLLGRKTLALSAFPMRKPALPTIRMGLTPCVYTREQLKSFLADFLTNSSKLISTDFSDLFVFGADSLIVGLVNDILADQK